MIEHNSTPDNSDVSTSLRGKFAGTDPGQVEHESAFDSQSDIAHSSGVKSKRSFTQTKEREPQPSLQDAFLDRWATEFATKDDTMLFRGANFLVMLFGVVMPVLIPLSFICLEYKRLVLLLLSHPIENFLGISLCLLIPIINFKIHSAICQNNFVFGLKPGITAGLALGTAFTLAVVCISASLMPLSTDASIYSAQSLFLTYQYSIGLFYLASALITLQLVLKVRKTKELEASRKRIITYLSMGSIVATTLLVGGEIQSLVNHYLMRQAISSNAKVKMPAIKVLRQLGVERQLRLLCADERSVGLTGLFLPVKKYDAQKLYFALEGKPFVIENSLESPIFANTNSGNSPNSIYQMNAEQIRNFAVGEKIPGISLVRSTLNGNLHPDNLSATLVWTMVFQNETDQVQKARAELSLPESAAITGVKLWQDGESLDGAFAVEGNTVSDSFRMAADGMLTELGRGKYLLNSKSLDPNKQVKMQVTMVLPMELDQINIAQLQLPQIIASNFSMEGEHNLELLSDNKIENSNFGFVTGTRADGMQFLSGVLTPEQIESATPSVFCTRKPIINLACTADNGTFRRYFDEARPGAVRESAATSKFGFYLERLIKYNVARKPGRIVVVLDGSKETSKYLKQIQESFKHVPKGLPVSLIVASNEDKTFAKPDELNVALPKLKTVDFMGGQDNLKSLVKAAEYAGQTKEGVVLWLHGRQPSYNKEIYIISPFAFKPALYEFAYDPAEAADDGFFKNHIEISNFSQVVRTGNYLADLDRFFQRWQAGRVEYSIDSKLSFRPVSDFKTVSGDAANELRALLARQLNHELLLKKKTEVASSFSTAVGIVSLNSSVYFDAKSPEHSVTPMLQGAVNGTIAPESPIVVQGVNTAGTIRVNNLANLEAFFNVTANLLEITLVILGASGIVRAVSLKGNTMKICGAQLNSSSLIITGILIIAMGLMVPGTVNFFFASARDAALFN